MLQILQFRTIQKKKEEEKKWSWINKVLIWEVDLGIVARDKVDVTYDTWKEVPTAQKDLIWEDIQVFEFSSLIFFNSLNLLFTYNKT